MSAEQSNTQPEDPKEPKPKAKRVMNEAMLENLKKAREKALASRQEMKLLKEREDILKQEEIDARWDKLHEEEDRIKAMKKSATKKVKVSVAKATKTKKPKIIHVSPPLSEESSVVSSSSEDVDEPKNSRRAHRNAKQNGNVQITSPVKPVDTNVANVADQASAEQILHQQQLQRAMKALGLAPVR
jgi:hypothetical protein